MTFKFVMACWYSQNKTEHDTVGDPLYRSKEKLVEKIIWLTDIMNEIIPNNCKNMKEEELLRMPQENLCLMEEQIKKISHKT
jgi:hypothetical protein